MNKKRYIPIVIILIVIIATVAVIQNIKFTVDSKKTVTTEKTDLGIPIQLETVIKGNLVENINYIGTIEPEKSTTVSPSISGQMVEIYVEEGDIVVSGQLLAKIDDSQLKSSIETSQKKLETLYTNYNYLVDEIENFYELNPLIKKIATLESNYQYLNGEKEKYYSLHTEGAISKTTYDMIQQEAETAYLQLDELKASIDDTYGNLVHQKDMAEKQIEELNASINELHVKIEDTSIKAPIQGIVKMVHYDVGDLAIMGMPFISIDDNEKLIVTVNVPESDIKKISIGNKTILKINGLSDEIVADVNKIIPNMNPNTRMGVLEIGPIDFKDGINLVSGNSVEVSIVINEAMDKIVIPKNAIKSLNQQNIVYLYKDDMVKETIISTGLSVGDSIEVIEGLEEGDKIAIKNLSKLYEDARVYVFKGEDK